MRIGRPTGTTSGRAILLRPHIHTDFLDTVGRVALVLDVGCGYGRSTRELAKIGQQAIGVDTNVAELQHAIQLEGDGRSIQYAAMDARHLGVRDNTVDVVSLLGVLGSCGRAALAEVVCESVRVLRPGGYLICRGVCL